MKKLNAFTIMELVVVMLLSGVTISMAYFSMEGVTDIFRNYRENADNIEDITFMNTYLKKDFSTCMYVKTTADGVVCVFEDYSVAYQFKNDGIIRLQQGVSDTLKVSVETPRKLYLEEEQNLTDMPVDRVEITFTKNELAYCFNAEKIYAADFYMRYEKEQALWAD